MNVRRAADTDAPAIAELMNALLATTAIEWTETPHTAANIREWMAAHDVVLVAEDQQEIIGFAAYGNFRDVDKWPGYRFVVENTIHVRESHWGSGVGRSLMHELVAAARAAGKHAMVAAVDGENAASIRFHEALGFVRVAELPQIGEKFGRWLDLVLLQLLLDDRDAP